SRSRAVNGRSQPARARDSIWPLLAKERNRSVSSQGRYSAGRASSGLSARSWAGVARTRSSPPWNSTVGRRWRSPASQRPAGRRGSLSIARIRRRRRSPSCSCSCCQDSLTHSPRSAWPCSSSQSARTWRGVSSSGSSLQACSKLWSSSLIVPFPLPHIVLCRVYWPISSRLPKGLRRVPTPRPPPPPPPAPPPPVPPRHSPPPASLGLGGLALAQLLPASAAPGDPTRPRPGLGLPGLPHFTPKAKRVIYLFQSGGPAQQDLFDY